MLVEGEQARGYLAGVFQSGEDTAPAQHFLALVGKQGGLGIPVDGAEVQAIAAHPGFEGGIANHHGGVAGLVQGIGQGNEGLDIAA